VQIFEDAARGRRLSVHSFAIIAIAQCTIEIATSRTSAPSTAVVVIAVVAVTCNILETVCFKDSHGIIGKANGFLAFPTSIHLMRDPKIFT
jgi:hypothetical protein